MKLKIIVLAALLFGGGVQAQNNPSVLLKKALDKMTAYSNFKAQFSYKMDNKEMNIHEKKEGSIYVAGNKYRIEIKGTTIISDGKTQWNIYSEGKNGTISDVDPTDLLSGSPEKILSKYLNYKTKFDKSKHHKNTVYRTIVLSNKKDKKYNKIIVKLDAKKLLLRSFSMVSKDGNVYTISLSQLKANQKLPTDTFTFDKAKYKGYDIEDMR